jgi:hypothetical protein
MNSFIVRVELHGALAEATYTRLHAVMAEAGFARTIFAPSDGRTYFLPSAMYTTNSSKSTNGVSEQVGSLASSTGLASSIFVARMSEWWSLNLTPVK